MSAQRTRRLATLIALVVLCVAWLGGARAHAQAPLALEKLPPRIELARYVAVLADPEGTRTFADVSGPAAGFVPNRDEELSFGFSYAAVWLRFVVDNARDAPVRWVLEFDEPTLDSVDVYIRHRDGRLEAFHGGDALPFAQREVALARSSFSLETSAHDVATVYVRLRSDDVLRGQLRAWQPAAQVASVEQETLVQWLFYGALLMLTLINLGVFVMVRHLEHFFCALAPTTLCLVLVCLDGQQAEFLFPEQPGLCARLTPLSMALAALCLAAFMRAVVRRLNHRHAIEHYFAYAFWGAAGLTLFCCVAPVGLSLRVVAAVMFTLGVTGPLLIRQLRAYPVPELTLYRRSPLWLCLSMPIAVLRYADVLPSWPILAWALQVGFVAHCVTTSLALASLASAMRRDLTKMNAQLVGNVHELEQALRRAEEAIESARRATKSKDEFVAAMSHELRTPLNAIINIPQGMIGEFSSRRGATCSACDSSYLLDENDVVDSQTVCEMCSSAGKLVEGRKVSYHGDAARALRFLQKIERSGQHLLQMVNGVLDYSKLEAGHFELVLGPVDLEALIREVGDQMSDIAAGKNIHLELIQPGSRSRMLLADVLRLKQVLINLIANAIKFSEADTEVTIRWGTQADSEQIEIQDRGIGIAADDHERIFASFEQVHKGSTRKYGGTGLGLSISRSLVRMHGGELTVRSAIGEGATFVIRLPRLPTSAALPSGALHTQLEAS